MYTSIYVYRVPRAKVDAFLRVQRKAAPRGHEESGR